jgi:hypothetical protein
MLETGWTAASESGNVATNDQELRVNGQNFDFSLPLSPDSVYNLGREIAYLDDYDTHDDCDEECTCYERGEEDGKEAQTEESYQRGYDEGYNEARKEFEQDETSDPYTQGWNAALTHYKNKMLDPVVQKNRENLEYLIKRTASNLEREE